MATIRETPGAKHCNGTFDFGACNLGKPAVETWNSGGLFYADTVHNSTGNPVWSLFYGNRWSISSTAGYEAGINGPWVDVECVVEGGGGHAVGDTTRPVPSYQLKNGSWRGFWQGDWPV